MSTRSLIKRYDDVLLGEKKYDIFVKSVGIREAMRQQTLVQRPKGAHGYLIMFFYDSVFLRTCRNPEGKWNPVETMIVWEPRHLQVYGDTAREWHHSWIYCGGRILHQLIRNNRIPLNEPFVFPYPFVFESSLHDIYQEMTVFQSRDKIVIKNILENLLRRISRIHKRKTQIETIPASFLAVCRHMENHHMASLHLKDLARITGYSTSHFCREFQRYFNSSVAQYLMRVRMNRAMHLLQDMTYNISEIADGVGYKEVFSFSKQFKKYYGISPLKMRRRLTETPRKN